MQSRNPGINDKNLFSTNFFISLEPFIVNILVMIHSLYFSIMVSPSVMNFVSHTGQKAARG